MSQTEPANNKELIQGFEEETTQKTIRNIRRAAVMASILVPLFGVLDCFVYRALFVEFLTIRGAVVVVSMGLFFAVKTPLGKRHPLGMAMLEYLAIGLSIVIMVHRTEGYASPYYAGINLVLIGMLVLLPLDTRRTAMVCAIIYASYIIPILAVRRIVTTSVLLNNNFFFLATICLVIVSSHVAAMMRFREYSARINLAKANEDLKQLDRMKSQFFANVSHEMRTPLTSIISPIQSMYSGDVGELSREQHEMTGQVYRNALRLLDMINQMLDFSRLEAGRMELRLSLVDLNEIARDTVTIFTEVTERKGITLHHMKTGNVPEVYLDRDKVERILTNLLRNAVKFTESGGILVKVSSRDGSVFLEVEDTGIGIPEDHLSHIFQRFQQVDGSSTRRFEGTGLGLAIVKESVDLLRGNVSVRSAEEKGTTFIVELPIDLDELEPDVFIERRGLERRQSMDSVDGQERRELDRRDSDLARVSVSDLAFIERVEPADEEDVPEPQEPTDTVLLVEDNRDLRTYVSRMLRRMGHAVRTATDGLEGWSRAQTDQPDVIVSDVMMPRMDGYELLERVKHEQSTRHIPVILVTAKPGLDAKLKGLKTGADDYLPKPINIRELDARIRNLNTMRKFQRALADAEALELRMEELSHGFAQSLELRDPGTGGHSRDVLELGLIIAEQMGLAQDSKLRDSLLLHDIGKIGIPDRILLKDTGLDDSEWQLMREHPRIGSELLVTFSSFKEVSSVILAHQEHYDGTGYPRGLAGEEIPLVARIVAVADTYHAMTNDRSYREAAPPQEAVAELERMKGTQFDPDVVDAFVSGLSARGILSR